MGLLDALFQSDNYGGQGGGLLDFLRQSQMQQANYQPSPGFPQDVAPASFNDRFNALPGAPQPVNPSGRQFDAATFDPSTYAPNQAQPIAVGGYQMPRIGDAGQYQPQQATLPANAQPTQGQIPQGQQPLQQPQQQQPMQLPPALGGNSFGGNLGASLQSFANTPGGLVQKLVGGTSALFTGQRTDPAGMQQENLRAQFQATRQALIDNGVDPKQASSTAMLSVLNPKAAETVLPELLTNKEKYQVVSEDPLTGKKYGFVNDRAQTVNGQPINAQTQPSASPLADLEAAKASGVSGEGLYNYLPSSMRNTVKAMIEGRQPLPSTAAMRSPATLALIDAAHAVDPTFDATSWSARQAGAKDFTSGKSSEMVRAANQTLAHVGSLLDAMDNLKNGRVPALNAVGNFVNEQTGGGQPGAFRTNAHAVAEEMSKVFKGANLSDAEIRQWEQNLSPNMSPEQQKAQIAKLSELLHGSLAALEEKRVAAIGPMAAAKAGPVIKEEGQKVLERIDNWVKGNGGATTQSAAPQIQEGATATNPQTGQKITFRNGKWQ